MVDTEIDSIDLNDLTRADYPQPNCPMCGRFASKDPGGGWRFRCVFWTGEGWEHT